VSDKRGFWTPVENALLRAMYPHCHTADVAAWLGRKVGPCYQHAAVLRLMKDAGYLASDTACRIQRGHQNPAMIASRIKPGTEPWNKGRKGLTGVQEACRATQFKTGRKPEDSRNYRPIGSLRITRDGILERKVTDDQSVYPARRWTPVARLVWEAEHGHIPEGHIVRFKPGMASTDPERITLDRLECVTRIENMQRNSVHTVYPPEVARLVQLRGALNRQINARTSALEPA
jgi:hypothetical protein